MADVYFLPRPHVRRRVGSYHDLQRHRTEMISAWTAWLATNPDPDDVAQEIAGTTGAMRSLAELLTPHRPDLFR